MGRIEPAPSAQPATDLTARILEFRGLEATFAGRVLWLGMVGVAFGTAFALITPFFGFLSPRDGGELVRLVFPDDPFNGSSYFGWPLPFLRIACPIHSDGIWHTAWRVFFADALILALPVLPFATIVLTYRKRRMERWRRGVCLRCEYDLRGLAEPRCPECGTPFKHVLVDGCPNAGI